MLSVNTHFSFAKGRTVAVPMHCDMAMQMKHKNTAAHIREFETRWK
jgi:hypothetical protein